MKKVYTKTKLLFMAISISSLSLFSFNAKAQGNGLLGIYYQDNYPFNLTSWTSSSTETYAWNPPSNITWFSSLITTQVDATINIPKGSLESFLSSVSGINPNAPVSIRWKGDIVFSAAGTYTFYLSGADGLRLKVNNNAIIGNFAQGDPAWVVRPYLETGTNFLPLTGVFTVSQNQVNTKIPITVEFYSADY
ncbi:MAG: PA14 domain-containing protein [Bacteroidia bacterium]|nr:PA14 domain-containing protein [Bacteroidia bacterium]